MPHEVQLDGVMASQIYSQSWIVNDLLIQGTDLWSTRESLNWSRRHYGDTLRPLQFADHLVIVPYNRHIKAESQVWYDYWTGVLKTYTSWYQLPWTIKTSKMVESDQNDPRELQIFKLREITPPFRTVIHLPSGIIQGFITLTSGPHTGIHLKTASGDLWTSLQDGNTANL